MEVATRTAKSTSPTNFIKKSEFFCSSKSYMGKAGSRNFGFIKYVKKKETYVHVFLYNYGHWIGIGNIIGWARKILHIFSELLDAFILHICKYILCIFSEWLDAWANFSTGRPWSGLTKQRGRILKVIEEGIFATAQHNLSFCNTTQHNTTQ